VISINERIDASFYHFGASTAWVYLRGLVVAVVAFPALCGLYLWRDLWFVCPLVALPLLLSAVRRINPEKAVLRWKAGAWSISFSGNPLQRECSLESRGGFYRVLCLQLSVREPAGGCRLRMLLIFPGSLEQQQWRELRRLVCLQDPQAPSPVTRRPR
jgi:hypothetical protein